jgi:hypothetical protein
MLLGMVGWRLRSPTVEHDVDSDRFYLLLMLVVGVLGLNLLSWPLLYLTLQSFVSEFPGVMCIYGVTRIGTGSTGPARHLPALLTFLQVAKPVLGFAGGAWFSLYGLNRRCETSPLRSRLMALVGPIAILTIADAGAEIAYLSIPKTENVPVVGCCVADAGADRSQPKALTAESDRGPLTGAFYLGSAILALAIWVTGRSGRRPAVRVLPLLCAAAAGLTVIAGAFAVDVAAPKLLGLPDHHCVYDLLPRVPEAVVAATLFIAGGFSLGWAWVLARLGRHPATAALLPVSLARLLRFALWCYLVSVPMVAVELALA